MKRRYPSFVGLKASSVESSKAKRANGRTNTKHETILTHELWRLGLRYRKNVDSLPGCPDIVFSSAQVVVFCDGDFWHGRHWSTLRPKLSKGANPSYWMAKIAANIARDKRNTRQLQQLGWRVLRVWETDILKNPGAVARRIVCIVSAPRKESHQH